MEVSCDLVALVALVTIQQKSIYVCFPMEGHMWPHGLRENQGLILHEISSEINP